MPFDRRLDKFPEQRMGTIGAGFEFRMKLDAHIKGIAGQFYRFDQPVVRGGAGKDHAMGLEGLPVAVVKLVAVAVPLLDQGRAVEIGRAHV